MFAGGVAVAAIGSTSRTVEYAAAARKARRCRRKNPRIEWRSGAVPSPSGRRKTALEITGRDLPQLDRFASRTTPTRISSNWLSDICQHAEVFWLTQRDDVPLTTTSFCRSRTSGSRWSASIPKVTKELLLRRRGNPSDRRPPQDDRRNRPQQPDLAEPLALGPATGQPPALPDHPVSGRARRPCRRFVMDTLERASALDSRRALLRSPVA